MIKTETLKILQVCHKIPYPPNDGGSFAIYNATIGLLEAGAEVNIIAINSLRDKIDINTIPADFRNETKLKSVIVDTRLKPLAAFMNLFRKNSYFVERFQSAKFEKALIENLTTYSYDIIQLEHLYLCLYIPTIRKHSKAKIVLRPQNVEYTIWEKYLKNLTNPIQNLFLRVAVSRLKLFEQQQISKVDGVIAISPNDAQTFHSFAKSIPIIDIPVGFIFSTLKNYDFEKQYENFPKVYHLGSMDWRPNTEAMKWFVADIFPLLKKEMPDLKIYMAGKKMPGCFFKQKHPQLFVEGTVPDALKYQEDKAIMIVPLLTGSGIRAKIIEGMALGKTIISTRMGVQGMLCTDNKDILLADTPEEFAAQLKMCAGSELFCREIGDAARKLAFREYHYLGCAKQMIQFYEGLLSGI